MKNHKNIETQIAHKNYTYSREFKSHKKGVLFIAQSEDDTGKLYSSGQDSTIREWDLKTG